jgi:hypothetical protein
LPEPLTFSPTHAPYNREYEQDNQLQRLSVKALKVISDWIVFFSRKMR